MGEPDDHELDIFQLIRTHQEKAVQLPPVQLVRTLLANTSFGLLSTFSEVCEGYPSGILIDFACDADGSPILAVSTVHAKNLLCNPKCSLLVTKDPGDRKDLIVTLYGDVVFVSEEDHDAIRMAYLAKHSASFSADTSDFQFVRIVPKLVHYVSSTAASVSGVCSKDEYSKAKVDPIYQFSKPIASHMNNDHAEETKLIVQHYSSIPVDHALMLDVDSVGFNVKGGYKGKTFKLRIPFPRLAIERKDVKTLIIEMLEVATKSSQQS
ncbi:glutamyl-tRNA reductase-binding protein, chloroplastic-like isoform X2 [Impatiens glandulifera]|uniref:glutamyl-tRNA reductase-binding protein, chloroplastic-like isoform X2 n=2 Tax=Impatiens glandulifera TaxID=253017 RepID=UPI001FB17191|nr:glutamyl-tRNA reductase-binding protein, chloroplastic-like isoform X2 [Impatiens glandulifera]